MQPKQAPQPVPPPEFQEAGLAKLDAAALTAILTDPQASEFRKAKACTRIGELGAKEAVPALAALLADEHLAVYARYGLEPIADPSADDALRAALPKLKGNLLIGVINSIGKRRDAKAAPALIKLMQAPDIEVARAATFAVGNIAAPSCVQALTAALPKVADAALICAERLLDDGRRDEAMSLYAKLSAPGIPKPARLGAMQAIIRSETRAR